MIHCRFYGKQIFRAICSDAIRDFGAIQFPLPGVGQGSVHISRDHQRIRGLPGLRLVAQQGKFERKTVLVLLDEFVHAAGVSFHHLAGFTIEERDVAFRSPGESVSSKLLVDGKRRGTQDLRELAARDAPQKIHLPEAVLAHHVALRFCKIFQRSGTDMRNAPAITLDHNFALKTGQGSRSIKLRERAVDVPPRRSARGN